MQGKKVVNHIYWHFSLTPEQPEDVQAQIAEAEQLAHVQADQDYNVIKYDLNSRCLSLLYYADFFTAPFPMLNHSYRINLDTGRIDKRHYHSSLNPPILHRKELLIRPDHPDIHQYQQLTATAEQLGLFDNTVTIGFKQAWENLIAEKGFQLLNGEFVPIGNQLSDNEPLIPTDFNQPIARHLTALSRSNLSAPMQCLARYGFLDGSRSVFDYGCGKGDDMRNLTANQIPVSGWDPHYAPDQPKHNADLVNLGFVINVIENIQERIVALQGAYALADQILVVSAMLLNQNAFKGQSFNDGVITQRNTFQKYFTQVELKEFISETLETEAIPVAPGIFFVFKDPDAEQRFLLSRHRNRRNVLRVTHRPTTSSEPKLSRSEKKYHAYQHLIDPLWQQTLELGRLPDKNEIASLVELTAAFKTVNKALQFMCDQFDAHELEQARLNRIDDLLTYFALQTFSRRRPYKHLEPTLQKDIKAFFGDYPSAIEQAQTRLFQIGQVERIEAECIQCVEQGLGYLDDENALYLHSCHVSQLPALLKIYIGCATVLYGDIEQTDLIKIHSQTGKLSLMRYDDFENQALPRLLERVKINLRTQSFDLFQYGEDFEPSYLYLKSRYINEEFPHYAEQQYFDEQLQALMGHELNGYGPKPDDFRHALEQKRYAIDGLNLVRSLNCPPLDSLCGAYLTYRQLIECGETQQQTGIENRPQQPDSYTALYELAIHVLDPVIDYFGMIQLTYGFCSHELGKHIKKRVAPKLDQHAAHERNTRHNLICPRLGAAVDFMVEDENMREVADWIAENTPFDRLYFYGENRPIHVSYGPEQKREYIDLIQTESGRQVPKKRRIPSSQGDTP